MHDRRELADFDPTTGHLHTCPVTTANRKGPALMECPDDCASHLYVIAQDAEAILAGLLTAAADPWPGDPIP